MPLETIFLQGGFIVIERKEEFVKILESRLKPERFIHSLNVADSAKQLANIYGADEEKAYICGLLHDIEKNAPFPEQQEYMLRLGDELPKVVLDNKKLWHAPAGACYIRDELGIKDAEMISAIKYHTTAKANMTLLEKIIYIADYISAERTYDGVEEMRKLAVDDINKAILVGTRFTLSELLKSDRVINQDTIDAYNEMCEIFEKAANENT